MRPLREKRNVMVQKQPSLTFLATNTAKAQNALTQMRTQYDDVGFDQADIIIALGGDGTMLDTLHKIYSVDHCQLSRPIYGMNCGSVGFLMNPYNPDNLLQRINNAQSVGVYPLHMQATDIHSQTHQALAFNEVSLFREKRQAAKLKITVDGKTRMNELTCDGALLSTPLGSTAYNFSAGGPIIPLDGNVFALTPISPFRPRRLRSALLHKKSKVEIEVLNPQNRSVSVAADSTEIRDVISVQIQQSDCTACPLLFDPDHNLQERIMAEQFTV